MVSSTPRPHFTPGKTRYPFHRRLGGPQGRFGRAENLVPTRIRSRTVQPVAQSLYRLSYPAHTHTHIYIYMCVCVCVWCVSVFTYTLDSVIRLSLLIRNGAYEVLIPVIQILHSFPCLYLENKSILPCDNPECVSAHRVCLLIFLCTLKKLKSVRLIESRCRKYIQLNQIL